MDVIEETLAENNITHSSVIKMIMTMLTVVIVMVTMVTSKQVQQ